MAIVASRREFSEYRDSVKKRDRREDEATAAKRKSRSFLKLLREFWRLLRGHRTPVVAALTTLTFATVLNLVPPAATKLAVDYVLVPSAKLPVWMSQISTNRVTLLFALAGGVLAVSFASTVVHLWGRWHATLAVNRLQVSIRKKVFEHAVRLPLNRIYQLKSGGAASVLREDTGGVAELIFSMLYNPWRAIVQLVGSLIILVWVDWKMMLGGVLLLPIVYVTHRTWIHRIRPLYSDLRNKRQQIDAYTTEAFGGMRVVRAFARERAESIRFVRNNDFLIRQQLFVWWWARIVEIVWDVLIPLASSLLLLYGGYRILQNQLTLGDLMMFLFYLTMLLEPLATLVASATAFQNNLAGFDRILDLLEETRDMVPHPGAISVSRQSTSGRITFDRISFQYPSSSRMVLKNISFDVYPGETIALVGRSGAGKTTLCNLVARFYDPTEGHIYLDGHDLRDIRIDSYRGLLGVVEQDVFLFDGTIADNVGYARRNASLGEIEQAARAAHAHEFIAELEEGYNTLIGERGVKLSGGQRQRLAIARALLADPKILILDEATSNLDSESERLIQQSLRQLMKGRTSFVIAHRMSTVRLADRIFVLDEGQIVEEGTHEQLMQDSRRYRRMVELQTED